MGKSKYRKIESIKELKRYGLPFSKTIFIFDFEKQEKELNNFLKENKFVAIRTDSKKEDKFSPCNIRINSKKTKKEIEKLLRQGYAVILHEQKINPFLKNQVRISGNILVLKNDILIEIMVGEPLTLLNREGMVNESIKLSRKTFKEVSHYGKRLIKEKDLISLYRLIKKVPPYKIIEFSLRKDGFYFWQIRDDVTSKKMSQ